MTSTALTVSRITVEPAVADYPAGTTFGPRHLHDVELVWIMAGGATWRRRADGIELTLTPGHLLLIPPGAADEFAWDAGRPSRHGYAHFDVDATGDAPATPLLRRADPPAPFAGLLEYVLWLGQDRPSGWRHRVTELLGTLLGILVDGPLPQPNRLQQSPALIAAFDHVRAVWARGMRPISTDELADAASISKAHLSRLFRTNFGCGPATGLELVRLEHARTLLMRTNMSVTAIARDSGYADPLHFSRRFRAVLGRSPRAYRRAEGTADATPALLAIAPLARTLTRS